MDKSEERVMVVPTAVFHQIGAFQGFKKDAGDYLARLLDHQYISFQSRAQVETDSTYKQLVPYVILRWRDSVFHYTRGKRGTENRLQALRSLGVGGHISAEDNTLFESSYREAMFREVAEEVYLDTSYEEEYLGLINDDSTPVGQVHLGIVHVFHLSEPNVRRREQALTRSGFAPIAELKTQRAEFETWSQFVLDVLD